VYFYKLLKQQRKIGSTKKTNITVNAVWKILEKFNVDVIHQLKQCHSSKQTT